MRPARAPRPTIPLVPTLPDDETDELRVTWMPAFPAGGVTLILLAVLWPAGALLTLAGLVVVVLRVVQRRWDVWAWVGVGALIGAAVYYLLLVLHAAF